MTVNARWVTVNGEQRVRITADGNPTIVITREQAWRLRIMLDFMVVEPPPSLPDNDQGEH